MGTCNQRQVHKRVDIRRNDTVKVMTGKDTGKEGRVLRVFPDEGRVLVEHVMTVKKHVRPNPQKNIKGGIAEQERRDSSCRMWPWFADVRSGAHRARSAGRPQGAEFARSAGRRWISSYLAVSSRAFSLLSR